MRQEVEQPAPAKESWTEVVRLGPLKPKAWVLYEQDRAKCKSRDITKNEILFPQLQIQRSERNDPDPKSSAGSWTTMVIIAAFYFLKMLISSRQNLVRQQAGGYVTQEC